MVIETCSTRGEGGGRKQQFEIQTLDQEAQGAPLSTHTYSRGHRAASGREEIIPALRAVRAVA